MSTFTEEGHWCDFCQVSHSSRSCFHPGAQRVRELEAKIAALEGAAVLPRTSQTTVNQKETTMTEQIPSIGRIVHYRLSADDATQINRRRTTGASIAQRMKYGDDPQLKAWPAGAQAHIGNDAKEGDTYPMLITKVWGDSPSSAVNGQVLLDGNDVFWATSRCVGDLPGSFSWPVRA